MPHPAKETEEGNLNRKPKHTTLETAEKFIHESLLSARDYHRANGHLFYHTNVRRAAETIEKGIIEDGLQLHGKKGDSHQGHARLHSTPERDLESLQIKASSSKVAKAVLNSVRQHLDNSEIVRHGFTSGHDLLSQGEHLVGADRHGYWEIKTKDGGIAHRKSNGDLVQYQGPRRDAASKTEDGEKLTNKISSHIDVDRNGKEHQFNVEESRDSHGRLREKITTFVGDDKEPAAVGTWLRVGALRTAEGKTKVFTQVSTVTEKMDKDGKKVSIQTDNGTYRYNVGKDGKAVLQEALIVEPQAKIDAAAPAREPLQVVPPAKQEIQSGNSESKPDVSPQANDLKTDYVAARSWPPQADVIPPAAEILPKSEPVNPSAPPPGTEKSSAQDKVIPGSEHLQPSPAGPADPVDSPDKLKTTEIDNPEGVATDIVGADGLTKKLSVVHVSEVRDASQTLVARTYTTNDGSTISQALDADGNVLSVQEQYNASRMKYFLGADGRRSPIEVTAATSANGGHETTYATTATDGREIKTSSDDSYLVTNTAITYPDTKYPEGVPMRLQGYDDDVLIKRVTTSSDANGQPLSVSFNAQDGRTIKQTLSPRTKLPTENEELYAEPMGKEMDLGPDGLKLAVHSKVTKYNLYGRALTNTYIALTGERVEETLNTDGTSAFARIE